MRLLQHGQEGVLELSREAAHHCTQPQPQHTAATHRRETSKRASPRVGAWPKTSIWRLWPSLVRWHLKPFSSRHCFWHIWQYQRSFCRPLAFMRLAICTRAGCQPSVAQGLRVQRAGREQLTALGERKSFFGILAA